MLQKISFFAHFHLVSVSFLSELKLKFRGNIKCSKNEAMKNYNLFFFKHNLWIVIKLIDWTDSDIAKYRFTRCSQEVKTNHWRMLENKIWITLREYFLLLLLMPRHEQEWKPQESLQIESNFRMKITIYWNSTKIRFENSSKPSEDLCSFLFSKPRLKQKKIKSYNRKQIYGKMHFYIDKCDEMARNVHSKKAFFAFEKLAHKTRSNRSRNLIVKRLQLSE